MARGGIYKSEVVRARATLLAQRRRPSVDAIRIELGNTGSKTTIQRFLKEIEEEEGGRADSKVALSEAIQSLTVRLAERLQAEADERISQLQANHAEELRAAREGAAALQIEMQSLSRTLDEAKREIADSKQRNEELAARYAAESQASAKLQQQAADLEIQIQAAATYNESIESKYADARRALEHFREAAKEQREREVRKHESEVQFLQQEVRKLQAALTEAQSKFVSSNEERTRLMMEIDTARRELDQAGRMKGELVAVTSRLAGAMADREALSEQLAAERRRAEGLAAEAQKYTDEGQRLNVRMRELEAELLAAHVRQETADQFHARIDEQIRVQFGRLLEGKKKPARA